MIGCILYSAELFPVNGRTPKPKKVAFAMFGKNVNRMFMFTVVKVNETCTVSYSKYLRRWFLKALSLKPNISVTRRILQMCKAHPSGVKCNK